MVRRLRGSAVDFCNGIVVLPTRVANKDTRGARHGDPDGPLLIDVVYLLDIRAVGAIISAEDRVKARAVGDEAFYRSGVFLCEVGGLCEGYAYPGKD